MGNYVIQGTYAITNDVTLSAIDCEEFLSRLPSCSAQLLLTSPPYQVGKSYEVTQPFRSFLDAQSRVIAECVRIARPGGSICWQVGSHVNAEGEIFPLDAVLYPLFKAHPDLALRNRIVWHFEHGLHCRKRFSGRHETILWFTKGDDYLFNLDAVRVPQKYPGKRAYRGAKRGEPSGHPMGKNPGDVWVIPNVKGNHVEKTEHPCQFPIALAETLILALTSRNDLVVDPYLGAGTTIVAAVKNDRRAAGCDHKARYVHLVRKRLNLLQRGRLPYRPRLQPVFQPGPGLKVALPPAQCQCNRESPVAPNVTERRPDTGRRRQ